MLAVVAYAEETGQQRLARADYDICVEQAQDFLWDNQAKRRAYYEIAEKQKAKVLDDYLRASKDAGLSVSKQEIAAFQPTPYPFTPDMSQEVFQETAHEQCAKRYPNHSAVNAGTLK